jgi:hypothetical protein
MHVWLMKLIWTVLYLDTSYTVVPRGKPITGIASRYGDPGDYWGAGNMACTKKPPDNFIKGCAHRTLPCDTILLLENPRTHRRSICLVLDRGPYGAMYEGKWLIKIHRADPGVWRGVLDLTPAVSNELEHNGFEKINIWVLTVPQPVRKVRRSNTISEIWGILEPSQYIS